MKRDSRGLRLLLACALGFACGESPPESATGDAPLPESQLSAVQTEEIRRLGALGYLDGDQPMPPQVGVTVHDPVRAWSGLNFYTTGQAGSAFLMDMTGEIVHVWEVKGEERWMKRKLRRAQIFENGEVLLLLEGSALIRLGPESEVLWLVRGPYHHDFEVQPDGRIYTLSKAAGVYPSYDPERPIRNEGVVILAPDGTVQKTVSMLTAFQRSSCCAHYLDRGRAGDIFHSNTIEVLDGRLEHRHPAFRRGNVLVSWRALDAIGIIDMESETVVWSYDGAFRRQHQPTVLHNGNILIFDNFDHERGKRASRVFEFDPFTGEIVWEFRSTPEFPFFSASAGASAVLPNGNVLITESRNGRVLEVARNGDIVWTYVNPASVKENHSKVARIFDLLRLSPDFPLDWLPKRTTADAEPDPQGEGVRRVDVDPTG